ncbi:4Fe-4S ferredoxin, iron-sulfur binding domain protein [Candidatus Sulfopaludibacter sp. SbA3]|nr:4Fe-4S ferredoxin, iron-sulfur binding domain protein [Candidatus Sulfopaludibacter sp. SbA3]
MEDDELYRALQHHLDRMPVAYPATESGVEIRILKQLFTPDEARLALCLSALPETSGTIHRRVRGEMSVEQLREALDRMADKGSIQKLPGRNGPRYGKAPLVLGMYEAQVNRLTPELERDVRAYFDEAFGREMLGPRTPQMRTVPVHKSIPVVHATARYDDIRRFVEASPGPFAAIPCVCRQGRALTGQPCRQTSEPHNCLMFGVAAAMMTQKGIARPVSKGEMLGFLEQADRQGLVLQPQNTADPLFVCCCCGCCCGVLTTAKKLPKPAEFFQSDFLAMVDAGKCQICGTCTTRCQMDAIAADDGPPMVLEERCIGCGLCVTSCPSEAMSLRTKERRPPPPNDMRELYTTMFKERFGPLGAAAALAGHLVGRKV